MKNNLNKGINISCFILLFCSSALFAQQKDLTYYETHFPKEHAIKILDETNIVIDIEDEQLTISRHYHDEKMLISTQANAFTERQVSFNSFFTIPEISASAYIPKSSRSYTKEKVRDFRTEKIMSDNVFHDDEMAIKFEYPNLIKGAKIDIDYTETVNNPFFVSPVYFQDAYFAEKIRVTLKVPEAVTIKIKEFNMAGSNVSYTSSTKKGVITHVWEVDSVPEFDSEGGAPNPRYYVPHISFIIDSYTVNGNKIPVLRGAQDLYGWYRGLLDSVDHTLTPEIKGVVDSIVAKNKDPLKQAQLLYDWVRNSIKYIAVEDGLGGFIPDDPAAVSRKRFGDCKGMSCLLATMMRYAGLDAHECWIGTRDIPYTYTENYTPFVDNHMITAFKHNNIWYFLDGTDGYIPFGYPSAFIQGKEAMIGIDRENFELAVVPILNESKSMFESVDTLQLKDELISANAKMTLTGYDAAFYKRKHKSDDDAKRFFKYYLQTGNDKFELTDLPNQLEKDSVVTFTYNYTLPDYLRNFDNKYLINLNMDRLFADATFTDRKLPLERDYKHTYSITHYLKVPDQFSVLSTPKNKQINTPFADVNVTYTIENGYVIYNMSVKMKTLLMPAKEAEAWNDMVKELRKIYRNNVELIKN